MLKKEVIEKLQANGDQKLSLFIEYIINECGGEREKIEDEIHNDKRIRVYKKKGTTFVGLLKKNKGKMWKGFTVLPKRNEHTPEKVSYSDTNVQSNGRKLPVTYIEVIRDASENRENILIVGPSGCGKTSLIRNVCSYTNRGLIRVNFSKRISAEDLVGRWTVKDNQTVWVDGLLVIALEKGYWFMADEINAADSEVMFALRSLLDEERSLTLIEKDGTKIPAHPNFLFIGTMNPPEDIAYKMMGKELSEADKDRFETVINMDYLPAEEEIQVIMEKSGYNEEDIVRKMVEAATSQRDDRKHFEILSIISTRRLIHWATKCIKYDIRTAFETSIGPRLRSTEREGITEFVLGKF